MFECTAWKNGTHQDKNVCYGIRFTRKDRDKYLSRPNAFLKFEGQADYIIVNTDKPSLWTGACRELIKKEIGLWLKNNGMIPWMKWHPPKLQLEPEGGQKFKVTIEKESRS